MTSKKKLIRITLCKGLSRQKAIHKRTAQALGLSKRQGSVVKEATPSVMGMVQAITHLVKVEQAE